MSTLQKFAVFDIDGTIFRSSLLIELVDKMISRGHFPQDITAQYEEQRLAWLNREGSYEDYIDAVVDAYRANIKGIHYGDFADTAREVVAELSKRTYTYTRELIEELKVGGYYLLAVSHSPKTILDDFCNTLGFDKVYGMVYEIGPGDMLTGEIADEHLIQNKANIIKRVVEKESLTLEGSIAVGDTESDVSMLELVERAICFNPNSKLYRHAQLHGWEVVVERKDVVYEL